MADNADKNADKREQAPIASALGDAYSPGRRKLLLVLCIIAIVAAGAFIVLTLQSEFADTGEIVPVFALLFAIVAVVVMSQSPKMQKLMSTAIIVYDSHLVIKAAGVQDATRVEYSQVLGIKVQGARRMQLRLAPPQRKNVVLMFNDKNSQYFAALIEEKQRKASRG